MTPEETKNRILSIAREVTGNQSLEIKEGAEVLENFDSLGVLNFVTHLEQQFKIVFGERPDDFEAMSSLDQLVAWLQEHG
jgi:acyl carrier protein